MMWRLPNRLEPLMSHSLQDTAQLNPDQLVRNCKALSTYQEDYVTSSKLAKSESYIQHFITWVSVNDPIS